MSKKKLVEITAEIKQELSSELGRPKATNEEKTEEEKRYAVLVRNYSEILLILERILEEKEARKEKMELVGKKNLSDEEEQSLSQIFPLSAYLVLDIKSLYEWAYHVQVILEGSDFREDVEAFEELERLSFVRGKFITHVPGSQLFRNAASMEMGLKTDGEHEVIEILFHSFYPDEKIFNELKQMMPDLEKHLPELKVEENFYNRVKILHRHRMTLPRKRRAEVKDFLDRAGVSSDSPAVIAQILLDTLIQYKEAFEKMSVAS